MESKNQNHLQEGLKAMQQHGHNALLKGLDEVTESLSDELNFKGSAKQFKSKVLEVADIGLGGTPAFLDFLNKNKYTNKGLDFLTSYARAHPGEIAQWIGEIETDTKVSLNDMGFDKHLYASFVDAVKKKGIFGEEAGLATVGDSVMRNLEKVTEGALNAMKGETIMGKPVDRLAFFISEEFGITPTSIREAYEQGGSKKARAHLEEQVISKGTPYLDMILTKLASNGIILGLQSEDIVNMYKEGGFIGKGGLIENGVKTAIRSFPRSDVIIYKGLLTEASKRKKEELRDMLGASPNFGRSFAEKQADEIMRMKIGELISRKDVPEILSPSNLIKVIEENGLYGKSGFFGYLADNSDTIFANAKQIGLMDSRDTQVFSTRLNRTSYIHSFKDLIMFDDNQTGYEIFAIEFSQKAESLGVEPLELLENPKYVSDRKEVIENVYGSATEFWEKGANMFSAIGDSLEFTLQKIDDGSIDIAEHIQNLKGERPKNKFFGAAYDAVMKTYIKKTVVERATDYLKLAKGLAEYQAQACNDKVKEYQTTTV